MNITLIMLAILASSPIVEPEAVIVIEPMAACEAASRVLRDMRYVEGRFADPGDFSHPKIQVRMKSCEGIAKLAAPFGVEAVFAALAVAYNEGNYRPGLIGKAGELGKMQVLAKHHCKGVTDLDDGKGGCINPERAGVRALRLIQAKDPSDKCIAKQRQWIRDERHRRTDAGKMQTVLKPRYAHAEAICDLAKYNGSYKYGRKVAAFMVSIERSYDKQQGRLAKR